MPDLRRALPEPTSDHDHTRALEPARYTYTLPEGRIARQPLPQRDAARLLHYRAGEISETTFAELPGLLPPDSLLVMNTTRVVAARLIFEKVTGARIELFCLRAVDAHGHELPIEQALSSTGSAEWLCLVGNLKRWAEGPLTLRFSTTRGGEQVEAELVAERLGPHAEGQRIRFAWSGGLTFAELLEAVGHVPLPPYLKRDDTPDDAERYQTVYAEQAGAVAAPTAGLHFTPAVLEGLRRRGVTLEQVVLHVGAGTFRPLTAERIADHAMHAEQIIVSRRTVQHLAQFFAHPARAGRGLVALGTTSMRTLESLYWFGLRLLRGSTHAPVPTAFHVGQWEPYEALATELPPTAAVLEALGAWMDRLGLATLRGDTQLLIVPGYPFRLCQGLITNFHQPQSTLLLLVAAFVGDDWQRVYDYALAHDFRFLSYGDGSLLWNPAWGAAATPPNA